MNPLRINILALAVISALFVGCLVPFIDGTAVVTIAGGLVGGYAATMTKLSEPPPDPAVPASIAAMVLSTGTGEALAEPAAGVPTRINILALAFLGTAVVIALAFATEGAALVAVLGVAGTLVGGLSATMSKLCDPPPDPSVPASVVKEILDHQAELQIKLNPGAGRAAHTA